MRRSIVSAASLFVAILIVTTTVWPQGDPRLGDPFEAMKRWLPRELASKRIPALSIAVVDDQTVVWAAGFGSTDDRAAQAGPGTVYRIGSVSKPITALLLMMLVEAGRVDLDAPVSDSLPEFRPTNRTDKKITLRQLLCHRSGLVRETPVGGYFDATEPSLADTVKSLNDTELVYSPESKVSYSNAGPSVAGLVIERLEKRPFAEVMADRLFAPLGMADSSVLVTPALKAKMPRAVMGTYFGREFPAPVFDLATTPAGNIVSTANDQAKLLSFLFADGGPTRKLLKRETLETMWTVQFDKADAKFGFGLGFYVSEFEGTRRIGHSGAVYGYATEFAALPDRKLGVIVMAARDVANGTTRRVADLALRTLLAAKDGKKAPEILETQPVDVATAKSIVGRYRKGDAVAEVTLRGGRLYFWPPHSGMRYEVRKTDQGLILDDALGFGAPLGLKDGKLQWQNVTYEPEPAPEPRPIPVKWEGLIGDFGPDHNHLTILEKDGVLHVLIEWAFLYPLTEVKDDVYKFPDYGLYHGHSLEFRRDASGRATSVEAAHYRFERRKTPEAGGTFQITPRRPIAELRKTALAATPPVEDDTSFRVSADLVDLAKLEPGIKLDLRYATKNNFLGTEFYPPTARAVMQRPAAEAVVRAHRSLAKSGYGLLIHDAYRPWHVTKMFFDAVEPLHHGFVADPARGSRHNRGCAVDLTLYDLKSGKPVDMVGVYDEFTDRSYPDYLGGTSQQRARRDLLRAAMEAEGFTVFENEWWHFDYRDWRNYRILNVEFDKLP